VSNPGGAAAVADLWLSPGVHGWQDGKVIAVVA
jgi:hypothetical protein